MGAADCVNGTQRPLKMGGNGRFRLSRLDCCMTIGTTTQGYDFGLSADDRSRHVHIIGQTGVGKSGLLENMIASDLAAGRGVAVLDPHGSLAEAALRLVPPHRFHQLRYINPADERPVPFNPLWGVPLRERPRRTDAIVSAFAGVWHWSIDSAPLALPLLRHAIRTALDLPEPTFLDVLAIVNGAAKRWKATDPMTRAYWDRLEAEDSKRHKDAAASVAARLDTLLASPDVRATLCQPPTFDIPTTLREGHILIANLNRGAIGEISSHLIGAFIVSEIVQAAFSGATRKWDNASQQFHQRSFYVFADEFQSFASDTFATALSEIRKSGVSLTLAHQFVQQVPKEIMSAVLGNTGTTISFRVGAEDAALLASHVGGLVGDDLPPNILKELPNYHAVARVLRGGSPEAVRLKTLPPPAPLHDRVEQLLRNARTRFGRDRALVEQKFSARKAAPRRARKW